MLPLELVNIVSGYVPDYRPILPLEWGIMELHAPLDKFDIRLLAANPHPAAVEYVLQRTAALEKPSQPAIDMDLTLTSVKAAVCSYPSIAISTNPNDDIVDWLLQHPEYIHIGAMSSNSNQRATQYYLEHVTHIDWSAFSTNESDLAVRTILADPCHMHTNRFVANKNPMAIAYIAQHLDEFSLKDLVRCEDPDVTKIAFDRLMGAVRPANAFASLSAQSNGSMIERLIGRVELNISFMATNTHDTAVDYVIKHCRSAKHIHAFSLNTNPKAVAWLAAHPKHIHMPFFAMNPAIFEHVIDDTLSDVI
jgi:hypothetical protein